MPAYIDHMLSALQSKGFDKGSAIAIGKSRGLIKQKGKHLAVGAKAKKKTVKKHQSSKSASGMKEAAGGPLY